MKRTIDIMTTAHAKGVELPAEWWLHCECCVQCGSPLFVHDGYFCAKEGCVAQFNSAKNFTHGQRYIGPDLELPENIHHAFTVADALGGTPIDIDHFIGDGDSPSGFYFHARWFLPVCKTDRYAEARAPERHLAIVAACEAALGIERGEVGV